jgi:phosphoadenosine phosphosulfate reductase
MSTGLNLTVDQLKDIAERGARELDGASPLELLQWTEDTFGSDFIVASNMQDGVLVHLAAQVHPGVDVLFLDTGYHFAETIGTRDAVESVYGVNVVNARAEKTVAEQDSIEGKDLFAREPNRCCAMPRLAPTLL